MIRPRFETGTRPDMMIHEFPLRCRFQFHFEICISPKSRFLSLSSLSNVTLSREMAPPFVFPQILRALEEDPEDNHRLFAQNIVDVTSLRPSDLEEFVKGYILFWVTFVFSSV